MDHQDWTNISLKNPSKQTLEKNIVERKGDTSINNELKKIENNSENFSLQKIPISLSKEIIKYRTTLKLTQKDISNKLNIQLNKYIELENGKAIYSSETKQLINKLERTLNIKLENKKSIV